MALPYQEFAFLLGIYYYTIKLQVKLTRPPKSILPAKFARVEARQTAFNDHFGVLRLRADKLNKEAN